MEKLYSTIKYSDNSYTVVSASKYINITKYSHIKTDLWIFPNESSFSRLKNIIISRFRRAVSMIVSMRIMFRQKIWTWKDKIAGICAYTLICLYIDTSRSNNILYSTLYYTWVCVYRYINIFFVFVQQYFFSHSGNLTGAHWTKRRVLSLQSVNKFAWNKKRLRQHMSRLIVFVTYKELRYFCFCTI